MDTGHSTALPTRLQLSGLALIHELGMATCRGTSCSVPRSFIPPDVGVNAGHGPSSVEVRSVALPHFTWLHRSLGGHGGRTKGPGEITGPSNHAALGWELSPEKDPGGWTLGRATIILKLGAHLPVVQAVLPKLPP